MSIDDWKRFTPKEKEWLKFEAARVSVGILKSIDDKMTRQIDILLTIRDNPQKNHLRS